MKFEVNFLAKNDYALSIEQKQGGLTLLDMARNTNPAILAEHLGNSISAITEDPIVILSEETARISGHFLEKTRIRVIVPVGALNKFSYLELREASDTNYYFVNTIDNEKLLLAWEAAGFPLEWENLSNEER